MPTLAPVYPTDANVQLLIGAIFAESSGKNTGGENADEKTAIGATFLNLAVYAKLKQVGHKKCYNSGFGDGTLLSAIKTNSTAYNSPAWNRVMVGNALKPAAALENLTPDDAGHLQLSAAAATSLKVGSSTIAVAGLSGKIPVNFNKAFNSPSSPRMVKIGKLGTTTFYGFITGRECQ